MLSGKLIKLVGIKRSDLRKLMEWRNNPDFRKFFREYRQISFDMQKRWYKEKVLSDPATMMFSIRRLKDDCLFGCCGLVYIHTEYRHADISLYIGWNNSYIDTKGYAEESCRLLLHHAFKTLKLNKVWTEIYSNDEQKKKLYKKLGFKKDGVLREQFFKNGRFWNSIILSILAKEWK